MYNINDYLVYKREVCKVIDIVSKYFRDQDYYFLSPLSDETLIIKVPVANKDIRALMSKEKVLSLIKQIPKIEPINSDSKNLETIYKELLLDDNTENLIKIIKTTYLRNKERIDKMKKTTDKDNYYFNLAEKYLYQEFQIVLNLTYDQTKEFVINEVDKLSS